MDRYARVLTLHRALKAARYPVPMASLLEEDRKSAALGQSVDLGGRRIIKKKQ